jgi:isopentenyl-diphosphate delta-isomerase
VQKPAQGHLTEQRKRDHLAPFRHGGVAARERTTLFECVHLLHDALPELDYGAVDTSVSFLGRTLRAPLFITGMTGGTQEAGRINRVLATAAERFGVAFGLGSCRAMLEDPSLAATYDVRAYAPNVFLAANLGGVQLARTPVKDIQALVERLGANALCVHLNPAQELMQKEGDRDFRGVLPALERLVPALPVPIIVKETGAGLSRAVADRLVKAGVRCIDLAGAGGTSWVGVELLRRELGDDPAYAAFWDWGIPTAAALTLARGVDAALIASGGIKTGLDVAKAIAMGATLVGLAAPVLQAYFKDGEGGVTRVLEGLQIGLVTAMLLCASRTLSDLSAAPHVVTGELLDWQRSAQVSQVL